MRSNRTSARRYVPTTDEVLEPRLALSGVAAAAHVHVATSPHKIGLNGQIQGKVQVIAPTTIVHTYTIDETTGKVTQGPDQVVPIADAPNTMVFHGKGHIGSLGSGNTQVIGSLYQGGFHPASSPDISGNLTLTSHKGSVLLSVTSGAPSAGAKASYYLTYKIVSGTGEFAHVKGSGKMLLHTSVHPGESHGFRLSLSDKAHGA